MGSLPSILWYSNPPFSNSGYGVCARHILAGLRDAGFRIGMAPNFGFSGSIIEIDGYTVHPQGGGFSEVETAEAFRRGEYQILGAQYDLWPLQHLGRMIYESQGAFVPYVPIDHEVCLPPIADQLKNYAFHTVAMCKYGMRKIQEAGIDDVRYIYHGVDTPVFKPLDKPKTSFRQNLGWAPDDFVIGMVQMNKGQRKLIPRQFEAIKIFMERNPDINVKIYLHSEPRRDDGIDLTRVLAFLNMKNVNMPDTYQYFVGFPAEQMAQIYNGFDVLMSTTSSEGFGLPIAEAQACGVPVVATDCTSMTELLEPTPELLVPVQTMEWNPIPARYWLFDVDKAADALDKVLNSDAAQYQRKLREWAVKQYDWKSVIVPKWIETMTWVGQQLEDRCWRIPKPSVYEQAVKDQVRVIA